MPSRRRKFSIALSKSSNALGAEKVEQRPPCSSSITGVSLKCGSTPGSIWVHLPQIADHLKVPAVPDQRTPGNDCDLHSDLLRSRFCFDLGSVVCSGWCRLPSAFQHFSAGGEVPIFAGVPRLPSVFQHFNVGGLASRISYATAPPIALASGGVARNAPASAASEMEHWGKIDLTTNHGEFQVATERDTMRHLSSSAQKAKRFSTGPKPSWYGGTGR
jgi:hypothetical protein